MTEVWLTKSFGGDADAVPFRLDVQFQLGPGITVLYGPSGSGKTLILESIGGFAVPDAGRILLEGRILYDGESHVCLPPQQRQCGYVFQNYALFPHMTVRDNLLFATPAARKLERHRAVNEMLERFRLSDVANRRPSQVSGGQKQRCSIARTLLTRPKLLLLDEPARGLDAKLRGEFYELLHEVQAEFVTSVLLVTHDLNEALELGSQMLVLHNGHLVQSGSPVSVCDRPASLEVAELLGLYNVLTAEIKTLDPGRNRSTLSYGNHEIVATYFPGHLKGDRVNLLVSPDQLTAKERIGRLEPNHIPATLVRAVNEPASIRLEFTNGLRVRSRTMLPVHAGEWVIEFPSEGLRIL